MAAQPLPEPSEHESVTLWGEAYVPPAGVAVVSGGVVSAGLRSKAAVTLFAASIVNWQAPVPLHAPLQPVSGPNARMWLSRLGLEGYAGKYPAKLSGGQRQRMAIARTLVLQPDVLLMDEPFSSLDAPSRLDLEELTLQLWQEQRFTFVVVTHAIEEAAFLGQKVLVLGHPPHTTYQVLENPVFGQAGCRDSQGYRDLCRELRLCLDRMHQGVER